MGPRHKATSPRVVKKTFPMELVKPPLVGRINTNTSANHEGNKRIFLSGTYISKDFLVGHNHSIIFPGKLRPSIKPPKKFSIIEGLPRGSRGTKANLLRVAK